MKRLGLVLSLLASFASAQVQINPGGASGSGAAAGSPVAGCTINSIVYIDGSGNLACGGAPAATIASTGAFATGSGLAGTAIGLSVSNGTSTGAVAVFSDGAGAVFTIADGGAVTHTTGDFNMGGGSCSISSFSFVCWGSGKIGFTSGNSVGATNDVFFMRDAAAVFQMGMDVNGAAVAQTIKAHDGITGTDIAGANLTLAGGRGTGIAAGGDLIGQTSPALATGTTAQTLEERFRIRGKQFALTDNTIATFAVQTLGNDLGGGGTMWYTVTAQDATTFAYETGMVTFVGGDATAGAGGEVCTTPVKFGNVQALSGSTLTVTFAASTGTDLCNVRVTADTDIATPTSLHIKWGVLNSGRPITPQ